MYTLESVSLKNFLGHKDSTFKITSGVQVLYGPEGSGKSTVIDAIRYVLTGETRGKLAKLVNNQASSASATLTIQKGRSKYEITRYRNDPVYTNNCVIRTSAKGKNKNIPVDKNKPQELEVFLGHSLETFDVSNINDTRTVPVLEMKAQDIRKFFDSVFQLYEFDNLVIKLEEKSKELNKELKKEEIELARLESRLQALQDSSGNKEYLDGLKKKRDEIKRTIDFESKLADDTYQQHISDLLEKAYPLEEIIDEHDTEWYDTEIKKKELEVSSIEESIADYDNATNTITEDATCPECLQPIVDESKAEKLKKRRAEKRESLSNQLVEAQNGLALLQTEKSTSVQELTKAQEELNKLIHDAGFNSLSEIEEEGTKINEYVDRLEQYEGIQEEVTRLDNPDTKVANEIKTLEEKQVPEQTEVCDKIQKRIEMCRYWRDAFDIRKANSIKQLKAKDSLGAFNQNIQSNLEELFSHSGEKFSVVFDQHLNPTVTNDNVETEYAYLGSGEQRLINIAISSASFMLLCNEVGKIPPVLLVDEALERVGHKAKVSIVKHYERVAKESNASVLLLMQDFHKDYDSHIKGKTRIENGSKKEQRK